jgi:hypothetical protein
MRWVFPRPAIASLVCPPVVRRELARAVTLAVGFALGAWGCSGERGKATGSSVVEVPAAAIDTDATLEVEAGRGVGVFVEYASGGRWRVFVACDSLDSDLPCRWDLLVSSASELSDVAEETFEDAGAPENSTTVLFRQRSAVHFTSETTTQLEGMRFETTPGATVRIDVLLDGVADGRFIYWIGGGAVHSGAPSSVLDLVPTAP